MGDLKITDGELRGEIRRRRPSGQKVPPSPRQRQALLDEMVRFELMFEEAKRRGYDQDPEVTRAFKKLLVGKLIREVVDREVAPSNAEIEDYYRNNQGEFIKAEEVRISQLVVKDRRTAFQLSVKAQGLRSPNEAKDLENFRNLVHYNSEDLASRMNGGDLGFLRRDQPEMPPTLLEAAFGLREVGAVSRPVTAGGRFHILKLTARRPPVELALGSVRGQISEKLTRERRKAAIDEFLAKLQRRHPVRINEERAKAAWEDR